MSRPFAKKEANQKERKREGVEREREEERKQMEEAQNYTDTRYVI